jgi:hypothetical protein
MESLNSPPVADPESELYILQAATPAPGNYTLSQQLMFLQEILIEYKSTYGNWDSNESDTNTMNSVQFLLQRAEAEQLNPVFTKIESLWLQEMLITFEQTHKENGHRQIHDFNLMAFVQSQVEDNFTGPVSDSLPPQGEPTNEGMTPPPADPYNP